MSWTSTTLGDLINLNYGKGLPEIKRVEGDVPVYGSGGIIGFHKEALIEGPGIIVGRKGTVGSVFWESRNFFPIDTSYYVTPKSGESNLKFIYYLLKSLPLASLNTDAAVPGLNRDNALRVKIKVPSKPIQDRIAEILFAYDSLIENNRRRIQLLEQSARLLYREWFVHLRFPGHEHVGIIDGMPEGWDKGTVSDFYKTTSGGTPSRKNPDFFTGEINWVKTQELQENFIFETDEKITEDAVSNSSAKLFPINTVLVAMYGATIGQTAILANPAATNQACCALFADAKQTHYIHAYLFLRENKNGLINLSQGSAQKNINQEIIKNYEMVMPSKMIMNEFIGSVEAVFDQIKNLQLQTSKLKKARDILLPRLMNGAIPV